MQKVKMSCLTPCKKREKLGDLQLVVNEIRWYGKVGQI